MLGIFLAEPYRPYVFNTGLFALSGGVTNWLAVHMLFERVPFLYGSGVIPMRFEEFKAGIRKLIMDQFFHNADLGVFFHGAGEVSEKLGKSLRQVIDNLDMGAAFESLIDVIMTSPFSSLLGMLGGRDALNSLKAPVVQKIREYFKDQFGKAEFQDQIQDALKTALDEEAVRTKLEGLIDQRLNQMTPQTVKEIIQEMIRKHLGWLVVWGCAFGAVSYTHLTLPTKA